LAATFSLDGEVVQTICGSGSLRATRILGRSDVLARPRRGNIAVNAVDQLRIFGYAPATKLLRDFVVPRGKQATESIRPAVTPSFQGLVSASALRSRLAASASKKSETKGEIALRRLCRELGLIRLRGNVSTLPGRPDLVHRRMRLAIFCDGDFWHGRRLVSRIQRLARGHNSDYWVRKIRSNVARDRRITRTLRRQGWKVVRVWESDVLRKPDFVRRKLLRVVQTTTESSRLRSIE
jgi:DNA mismatch endonuclease (patch repair protein)